MLDYSSRRCWPPDRAAALRPRSTNHPVVLYSGRLVEPKGIRELIEAIGFGPLGRETGRRTSTAALLTGVGAFLVDGYLY